MIVLVSYCCNLTDGSVQIWMIQLARVALIGKQSCAGLLSQDVKALAIVWFTPDLLANSHFKVVSQGNDFQKGPHHGLSQKVVILVGCEINDKVKSCVERSVVYNLANARIFEVKYLKKPLTIP